MIQSRRRESGFTAVELIIALIVGVLLLGSAYQLYTVVISDTGDSLRRSAASNAAYELLRKYQADDTKVQSPCVASTTTIALPASTTNDLPGATAQLIVACPYATLDLDNLNLVTVKIDFNNVNERAQVSRALTTDAL